MIITVKKIKIFDFFIKTNSTGFKVIMSIFEFLSSHVRISFNEKWRKKIRSILVVLKKNWKKAYKSGYKKKIFIQNLSKQYFKFDVNTLENSNNVTTNETVVQMDIDPISSGNSFSDLLIAI